MLNVGAFSPDILSFESTCRALSASLVSARAVVEKARKQTDRSMSMQSLEDENGNEVGTHTANVKDREPTGKSASSDKDGSSKNNEEKEKEKQSQQHGEKKKKSMRSHRSSKRVLSQKITSGKNAERSAKRKSVEYCLVSAIFSCTTQHPIYSACLKNEGCWTSRTHSAQAEYSDAPSRVPESHMMKMNKVDRIDRTAFSSGFGGDSASSLKSFVSSWSGHNSGASDILCRFLSHVSRHVVEIFSSEYGDSVALSSCILECK